MLRYNPILFFVYKLDLETEIFNKIDEITQETNVDEFILDLVSEPGDEEDTDFQRTIDEIN